MDAERRRQIDKLEVLMKLPPLVLMDVFFYFFDSPSDDWYIVLLSYCLQALVSILTLTLLLQKYGSLVQCYKFLGKVALLLASFVSNVPFDVNHPLAKTEMAKLFLQWDHPIKYYGFSILQMFLAILYTIMQTPSIYVSFNTLNMSVFFFPIIFSLDHQLYPSSPVSISTLTLAMKLLWLIVKTFPSFLMWCTHFVESVSDLATVWRVFGFNVVVVLTSTIIRPKILLQCLFWIRTSVILVFQIYMYVNFKEGPGFSSLLDFLRNFVLNSASTKTGFMAVSSLLTEVALPIITIFEKLMPFPQFSRVLANDFGFLFFILSLHYDIPCLPSEQKFTMMYVNLCQCMVRFLMDIYEKIDLKVLTLNPPQNNPPPWRILLGYAILLLASGVVTVVSWPYCSSDPLLYSALVCFLSIVIKIPVSALAFCMLLQLQGARIFEKVSLACAIVDYVLTLVANATMLFFESYAYFLDKTKVFKAFRILITFNRLATSYANDWEMYITALNFRNIMNSLPNATEQQLRNRRDVCPICRDELAVAKVTPCGHLFHFNCLKTWVKRGHMECPLCFTPL